MPDKAMASIERAVFGRVLTAEDYRDALVDIAKQRNELQAGIEQALHLLDTRWVWCFGRKRIDPAIVRSALLGTSGEELAAAIER